MENDILNLEIGDKPEPLEAGRVSIVNAIIDTFDIAEDDGTKRKGDKVLFNVVHATGQTIKVSEIVYINNGKVVCKSLWLNKDNEGKIKFSSPLANMLRFFNAEKIADMYGREVETILPEGSKYLAIKAY